MKTLILYCVTCLLLNSVALNSVARADENPNVIFILADDCSYLDLELYGGPAKTPHLNSLAKTGMTFNRCYQAAPMCSPTRHALYTGLYPVKSGAYPNHAQAYENIKSIPHFLADSKYRVVLDGKTHIAPPSVFPFEYFKEFAEPADRDVPRVNGWRYPQVFNLLEQSAKAGDPFCLFLCSNEPHGPYTKGDPTPYADAPLTPQQFDYHRKEYAKYLAEITYFDGQVGEILAMLDQLDLRKKTLVMVATEQGSGFPFGKWTCYEIGVASGLVASWPGVVAAGSKTDAIVEYTDVVPTLLDVTGIETPPGLDGRSFFNLLQGKTQTHKQYAFSMQTTIGVNGCRAPYGVRTVVGDRYRYIRNLFPENEFSIPVSRTLFDNTRDVDVGTRERADRFLKRPPEELYDILKDPYCQTNLFGQPEFSNVQQELSTTLEQWMTDQGDSGRPIELEALDRQADWRRARNKPKPAKADDGQK